MTNEQDSAEERYLKLREFSRVDAQVPLEVRLVPPEERSTIRSKISGETVIPVMDRLPDIEDTVLADWLRVINAKLDAIINLLSLQREGFCALSYRTINISGGGMSFTWTDPFAIGDIIEIKTMFPLLPPVAIHMYGEVVKSEPVAEGTLIGVKFVAMDEEIRDEIVKFVFKRQREILREKRR